MTVTRSRTLHFPLQALMGLFIALAACTFTACSNSEPMGFDIEETATIHCRDTNIIASPTQDTFPNIDSIENHEHICDTISEYLPLNDSKYPYAGIPRIVIETENHQAIKDRETEISAKLQIWGEKAPESEIMELTIKGRGNTTWKNPKKPYTIKFEQKQEFLGMKNAKKWVLLANYLDRTLMRNAIAFEIARHTNLEWTPNGKFAELFLNGKFLGNYFVCEEIQINKNRLNISEAAYLLELDINDYEDREFKSLFKKYPINIRNPDNPSKEQIDYIQNYIDTVESFLYGEHKISAIENYLDLQTFADYLIVHELSQNSETLYPKSVYMYKDSNLLKIGPVWDFDWGSFVEYKKGWQAKKGLWFNALLSHDCFKSLVKNSWMQYKKSFENMEPFIDSLAEFTRISNERNIKLWPVDIHSKDFPDMDKSFDESISMMKSVFFQRIIELDSLFMGL